MNLTNSVKRLSLLAIVSIMSLVSFAQSQVTGHVRDKSGEPIVGASILIKGTGTGTVTDIEGAFTVAKASPSDVLIVSSIGYSTENVKVGNQTRINVVLNEDMANLDEVVVIGYGTMKRRDLTGSVSSVNNEALTANPVANVAEALQGKLAGVQVLSQDGRPGASVSIRVRGGGSISQSNDPLFVVDGFPVSDINDIPADQIESIDVLKDASSTAIYGARGGNGVILVTTKGGREGKVSVSYNGYYQAKWAAKTLGVLDAQDYVALQWGYSTAGGWNADDIARYFGLGSKYGNNYDKYASVKSHDYTDDMLRTASSWNHNVSVSGGTKKTQFTFSANYVTDEGIKINSNYDRLALNFKLRQELAKNLYFDIEGRYSKMFTKGRDATVSSRGSLLSSAYVYRPIDTPYGEDDFTLFGMGAGNIDPAQDPYDITNTLYSSRLRNRLRGTASLSWEPIKGLTLRSEIGVGRNWGENKFYDDGSILSGFQFTKGHKYAELGKTSGENWRWLNTINYEVQGLGEDHSLSVMLGNEEIKTSSETLTVYGSGFPMGSEWTMDRVFGLIHMGDATAYPSENKYINTYSTPETTQSWFGRINYSYKGRYLVTGTLRADGSSKFGPNNHWGYFPAGAVAWRISDEAFMQGAHSWLDNLKLRLSIGTSGNDNISSSLWRETWSASTGVWDEKPVQIYKPSGLKENPDLKWETNISRNLGLDFAMFNRVSGSVDLYWNTTKDLLMNTQIDSSSGYTNMYDNIGKTSNKGLEVALNTCIVRSKDFNLNMNLTYNLNFNKVEELADHADIQYGSGWASAGQSPGNDFILTEGEPVGLVRGYTADGVYTLDDFNYTNGKYVLKEGITDISNISFTNYPISPELKACLPEGQNAFPGCLKLKDLDGDGIVDTDDISVIGRLQPHHTGGFGFTGNWKGLDFSANFTYQLDGKIYNASAMCEYTGGKEPGLGKNRRDFISECWKIYDVRNGELVAVTDPTELASLNANASRPLPYYENNVVSSEFIESAAYLRLSNITVGYSLPKKWFKGVIERVRLYATMANVFCITGYSGYDPEVNTDASRNSNYPTPYMDYGAYVRPRTFTFGVNVKF